MRARWLVLLLLAAACDRAPAPTPAAPAVHASLGGDAVARVGDVVITAALVGAVAGAERTDARVALDRLIEDALAAEGARASGADRAPPAAWTIETVVGRATVDRVRRQVRAAGPPTDAEVEQITKLRWLDFDLPEQVRVVHAVVRRPKDLAQYDAARALAARIASAVAGAKDDADFQARASAVPHGDLEVVVQDLPPFVADGRYADPKPSMIVPAFAKGAFALKTPGETSGVVESPLGWHVIRLIERLPPKIVPLEQRRTAFAEEVFARRGRAALDALLQARRARAASTILPDADARMAEVSPRGAP